MPIIRASVPAGEPSTDPRELEQTHGADLAKPLLPELGVENGGRSNYWSTLLAGFTPFPISFFHLEVLRL